jgi:acetyltransferase-like isoleucine patch superfamily enzyme
LRRKVVIGDYCKIDKMGFLFGDYNEGIRFGDYVNIATNCRIQGKGIIASISSISHNGSISGEHEGVVIGEDVMIGPKVVFVAFNHGFELIDVPMKNQQNTEESILIKYNVWIGANVTIGKGVTIG